MARAIRIIPAIRIAVIQSGESTHAQDHAICPVSFRMMKATVRSPAKPTPSDELELELLLTLFSFINAQFYEVCVS